MVLHAVDALGKLRLLLRVVELDARPLGPRVNAVYGAKSVFGGDVEFLGR